MSISEVLLQGVEIRVVEPANVKDTRGQTLEWHKGEQCQQLTSCFYGKGSVAGNHWHCGDDPSKNPERFMILYGRFDLVVCDGVRLKERYLVVPWDDTHAPRYEITIAPCILHALLFHTPGGFVEWRQTAYAREKSDTYGVEVFREYLLAQGKSVFSGALEDFASLCREFPARIRGEA